MRPTTDDRYIRPRAAYERMKKAQNMLQTIYMYGASGCGKTAFIAQFLKRKKYEYYTADEAASIEVSSTRLPGKERIVVIDNLYELWSEEERAEAYPVLAALSGHPDVWLILISRCEIPGWLKNLNLRDIFLVIPEKYFYLSQAECEELFAKYGTIPLQETMDASYEIGGGFALSVVVLAVRMQSMDENLQGEERRKREKMLIELAMQDFSDYLYRAVYAHWDDELTSFIMELSIVGQFDMEMAHRITKKNNTAELLRRSVETGNFLTAETDGNGHTLYTMRNELVTSMHLVLRERYTQPVIENLYRSAAEVYEKQGDIPKALQMYEQAHDHHAIMQLLTANAQIHPGAGHYWELRRYYLNLPEEDIRSSILMMSAMSMLQSILMNDEESERWYHELEVYANSQTGERKKLAKMRLVYLDVALPHRGSGQIYRILKHLGTLLTQGKQLLPEMSLTNNQPSVLDGGKDFSEWTKKDRVIAASIGKTAERLLGSFGKGLVDIALAESLYEKGVDNYEVYRMATRGKMHAEGGGRREMEFAALGTLAQMEMFSGNLHEGIDMLEGFREKIETEAPQLVPGIETARIRLLLREGYSEELSEWLKKAPNEDAEFCTLERYRYITKAKVYLALGMRSKARRLLEELLVFAEERARTCLQIETLTTLSILQHREEADWITPLQQALDLASEYHYVRCFTREGAALLPLLLSEDLQWKDIGNRHKILEECAQQTKLYPHYLEEKSDDELLLSEKARQILRMQAEGKSVAEIAEAMQLSAAGVKYYNRDTYKKLGVREKTAAVTEARRRGLL